MKLRRELQLKSSKPDASGNDPASVSMAAGIRTYETSDCAVDFAHYHGGLLCRRIRPWRGSTPSEAPGWLADSDQLLVDELVRAILAELPPPAGPLDAAEWQLGAVGANDVDVDHAGFDLVGHAVGLLGIGREQVGAEPERRVVRQLDRLLLRADAVDDRDRT